MAYEVYSPSLGWTIGNNQVSRNDLYRSNGEGIRANREFTKEKPPGKIRVLCFGDSYTHCDEVENHQTWQHHAEQTAPHVEFLNFGVPGYGMTQAYLRYREVASRYAADYVIIGCMTDDLKRSVNAYYPFRYPNPEESPNAMALPYSALDEAGQLVVHPPLIANQEAYKAFLANPLPILQQLSKADILFRKRPPTPFLTVLADRAESLESRFGPAMSYVREAWQRVLNLKGDKKNEGRVVRTPEQRQRIAEINRLLLLRFAEEVKASGAVPIVVWFPSPANLRAHNTGKPRDYQPFIDFFNKREIVAVDTMDWLEEIGGKGQPLPVEKLLARVHFSASTNAHLGRRIAGLVQNLTKPPLPE
ncbi:MAG: SGNH/GDSL hydrolase family protein [Roseimicrobium sp.]